MLTQCKMQHTFDCCQCSWCAKHAAAASEAVCDVTAITFGSDSGCSQTAGKTITSLTFTVWELLQCVRVMGALSVSLYVTWLCCSVGCHTLHYGQWSPVVWPLAVGSTNVEGWGEVPTPTPHAPAGHKSPDAATLDQEISHNVQHHHPPFHLTVPSGAGPQQAFHVPLYDNPTDLNIKTDKESLWGIQSRIWKINTAWFSSSSDQFVVPGSSSNSATRRRTLHCCIWPKKIPN